MSGTDMLPTWNEVAEKLNEGVQLTALEQFIYDNEPAGVGCDVVWRAAFQCVLKEASRR